MIPEIDIWRVANLMLKRYGDEADIESAIRAEELAEAGDRAGEAVWRRVIDAIGQLLKKSRAEQFSERLASSNALASPTTTGGKVRAHPFRPPSGPVIHPACGSPWAGSDCCAGAPRRRITLAISQCVISRLRHVSPQGV
jgi:hypothetical protein